MAEPAAARLTLATAFARRAVRLAILTATVVLVAGAGFLAYAYHRLPIWAAVVYATAPISNPVGRVLATHKSLSVESCPVESFDITSPLQFLVSAMQDKSADRQRLQQIFEHFQDVGCDINGLWNGRAAIHDAVLYGDPAIVSYLMTRGADPDIRMQPPARRAGLDAHEYAELACRAKTNYDCAAVRKALAPAPLATS